MKPIIGLTGGIGSGKSYVGRFFNQFDIPIYLADKEAKRLMIQDPVLKSSIKSLLGKDSYHRNGRPNRPYIAQLVFNNKKLLKSLNKLVHPAVQADFRSWANQQKAPYAIEESALLFEIKAGDKFDKIILVTAPKDIRINRVIKRDNVTKERVLNRMKNQLSDQKKIPLSDFVIINDGKEDIAKQVQKIHNQILKLIK